MAVLGCCAPSLHSLCARAHPSLSRGSNALMACHLHMSVSAAQRTHTAWQQTPRNNISCLSNVCAPVSASSSAHRPLPPPPPFLCITALAAFHHSTTRPRFRCEWVRLWSQGHMSSELHASFSCTHRAIFSYVLVLPSNAPRFSATCFPLLLFIRVAARHHPQPTAACSLAPNDACAHSLPLQSPFTALLYFNCSLHDKEWPPERAVLMIPF